MRMVLETRGYEYGLDGSRRSETTGRSGVQAGVDGWSKSSGGSGRETISSDGGSPVHVVSAWQFFKVAEVESKFRETSLKNATNAFLSRFEYRPANFSEHEFSVFTRPLIEFPGTEAIWSTN